MKKDMTELKKLVLETYQSGGLNSSIMKKHQNLFEDMETSANYDQEEKVSSNLPLILENLTEKEVQERTTLSKEYENQIIEDITHEEDDNSLSIEKKEKELILRALKKHHNKRKYAAMDLGISERTLYRKIKQYDIQE